MKPRTTIHVNSYTVEVGSHGGGEEENHGRHVVQDEGEWWVEPTGG